MQSYSISKSSEISGVQTSKNYVENHSATFNLDGWVAYNDGTATPVDLTGGVNIDFIRTTTNPLNGRASFLQQGDVVGIGASTTITPDRADVKRGSVMSVSFDYEATDGNLSTGDYTVWAYDVFNSRLIQLAGFQVQGLVTGGVAKFGGTFQLATNTTTVRIGVHQAVAGTDKDIKFSNFSVGPQVIVRGAPVTDWGANPWIPTGSWTGTTTYTGRWRRVGDVGEYEVNIALSGAPTGGNLTDIFLPSGHVIDTAKLAGTAASSRRYYGSGFYEIATAGATGPLFPAYRTTTSVRPVLIRADGTYGTDAGVSDTIPGTFASGGIIQLKFSFPIVGWSSSVQMSNDADTRVVAMAAQLTAQSIGQTEVTLGSWTQIAETHGAFNVTTGIYTAPVPGYYEASGGLIFAAHATGSRYITFQKNASGSIALSQNTTATSATVDTQLILPATLTFLNAGDTLRMRAFQNSGTNLSIQPGSNTTFNVKRISGPSAIAASETVTMRASTTNAQAIASSATAVITTWTTGYDSHAGFNATNGVYTVQTPGRYRITAALGSSSTAWTTSTNRYAALKLSGTKNVQIGLNQIWASVTNYLAPNGSTTENYLAGDTISISLSNQTGSTFTLGGFGSENWLTIERVGN